MYLFKSSWIFLEKLWERKLQNAMSAWYHFNTSLSHTRVYYILFVPASAQYRATGVGWRSDQDTKSSPRLLAKPHPLPSLAPSLSFICPEDKVPCFVHEDAVAHRAICLRRCIQIHQFARKHHDRWTLGGLQMWRCICGHQRGTCCDTNGDFSFWLFSSGPPPKAGKELRHAILRGVGFCKFCQIQIF